MCFSNAKKQDYTPPAVEALPDAVAATPAEDKTGAVSSATDSLKKKLAAATGRQSTILTSSSGVADQATIQKKTLLGQ